ncbi:PTS glucose transporter subunit IIBC [Klebsiella quasipneumoniae subsp. quasipneumoniae]|uniref:PTS transporter subunit EIIC n=1 Tax=Klebsiella quasipneumoniae TaxID=1463165 RepID=UPI000B411DEE|nr:PTS transporter subunit EIIC [Klebsiella quasipneumoniae]OVY37486.1 PTS glucose transporter subunit IIBC [Klebsiella quasipneumoniae subsp. quasipneumoniae]
MIGVKKLQDFSKAMIGPVLYLPAIGLLIALFSMTTNRLWVEESSGIYLLGKFVSSMLWALMNNLGFLFCLGLASGLAKTRKAEAAFVAAMTWLVYLAANNSWLTLTHRLATGATNAQLYGSGQTYIFGFQVIDMGVFLGIILGCAVAFVHNRVVGIEFRGALSIYGNSKLVLIVMLPLVGITEPFEFLFIFTAPLLWLIYSLLDGFFQMLAWLLHVRVCATNGLIDFVVYNLPAGASVTRWPVFVLLGLLETATMYLVGTFCITRLRMLTPGREDAADAASSPQTDQAHGESDKGALVIAGLGGKENVCTVENCFTRLRVDVRDPALIQQTLLKESGGNSVLIKGNHVQVIYGLGVNKIRTAVNASLGVTE